MLNISPETVCFIAVKAREYNAKVVPYQPDDGSNPTDDRFIGILQHDENDPTLLELRGAIAALNEDEVAELVALTWLGRGDYTLAEWDRALSDARYGIDDVVRYLTGIPLLGDYLEEGLGQHGHSCYDFKIGRL